MKKHGRSDGGGGISRSSRQTGVVGDGSAPQGVLLDVLLGERDNSELEALLAKDRAELEALIEEVHQQNEVFWADYWAKHDADIRVFLAELEVGAL